MANPEDDKVESVPLTSVKDGDEDGAPSSLPAPVSTPAATSKAKPKIPAIVIIPVWMAFSVSVILYNNHLYNTLDFKFPVFLVTWHLTFSAIGTRVLQRTTNLLDGTKDINMNKDMFLRSILPIGILFSGSLILSNSAYLYLSISYIQMLKAFNAVAVLLISWLFRISEPNRRLGLIVFMISFGVALTSTGELKFNLLGFIIQAAAVVFEASRLVMIEILLHGMKMDPLVSLHYYAPICALINLLFLPFTEGLAPFYQLARLGPLILLSNAFVAFFLNVAAVFLVGVTSGLVLTLAGVFKDILLIIGSVIIFSAQISPLQVFGTPFLLPRDLYIDLATRLLYCPCWTRPLQDDRGQVNACWLCSLFGVGVEWTRLRV
ncbi:TPT domain-containing protein [Mycena kentingensis (nom. inval.)]|nr:TPT domain-containing protein [Mycena kentingensis (nom. inval.)]